MPASALYGSDLAHVHDVAFGAWARDAAPFVLARLHEAAIADGPPSLEPLLRRVYGALEPGGLLVFDAAGPGREPELRRRIRQEGDGWLMRVEAHEDRAARTLTRRIALVRDGRGSEELHVLRLYEPEEVVEWLEAAGFAVTCHPSYGAARGLPGVHVYVATRAQR